MIRLLSVFLISFILNYSSYCQELTDSTFKAGFYRKFSDFKTNQPVLEFNYLLDTITEKYGFMLLGGSVDLFKIKIKRKEAKLIGKVFGFSDGKDVYFNYKYPKLKPNTRFNKITIIGNYCYFEDVISSGGGVAGGAGVVAGGVTYVQKIIEITSGKVFFFNKDKLLEIISDDLDLVSQFKNENKKNTKLKLYLVKYYLRKEGKE